MIIINNYHHQDKISCYIFLPVEQLLIAGATDGRLMIWARKGGDDKVFDIITIFIISLSI